MQVRDEAHRFGITQHRKLRKKKTLASELDTLSGIGQHRKKLLLQTFGSVKKIKKASPEELSQVPGIGEVLAQSLYTQLRDNRETG
jgi:excinuclease ABC subunit C